MPDEAVHEGEVLASRAAILARAEITSTLPNSGLPALYFVCDEHASNFQRGGRFSVDPRKGNIDLGFRRRFRPNSVVNYVGPIELEESTDASPVEQTSEQEVQIGPVYEPLREPSIQTIRIPHLELMQHKRIATSSLQLQSSPPRPWWRRWTARTPESPSLSPTALF